jgi:hypothetical protein
MKAKNICQKNNFTQFPKEKLLKSFVILEIFVFLNFRPKNSAPESQTSNLELLEIKNNFKKLRTMTQNQLNFRPANKLSISFY